MNSLSYFPNYFSIEDIFVTQEKVECKVIANLLQMGFLDPGAETDDLDSGKTVNLPLWYIKDLKVNNLCFSVQVPNIYKSVHKAVCEAETTHIELGKLHPHFYEYGRYITPYDRNHTIGKIIFETLRQRVRYLLDISKNTNDDSKLNQRLDSVENKLYGMGVKTNTNYINWLQMKATQICSSEMVQQHAKKRKRDILTEDEGPRKRS